MRDPSPSLLLAFRRRHLLEEAAALVAMGSSSWRQIATGQNAGATRSAPRGFSRRTAIGDPQRSRRRAPCRLKVGLLPTGSWPPGRGSHQCYQARQRLLARESPAILRPSPVSPQSPATPKHLEQTHQRPGRTAPGKARSLRFAQEFGTQPVTLVTPAKTLGKVSPSSSGDSGRTGDTPPRWDVLDHWRQRLGRAGISRDARTEVVLDWVRAAGGDVDIAGETVRLTLPSHLREGYALAELKRLARDLGLSQDATIHKSAATHHNRLCAVAMLRPAEMLRPARLRQGFRKKIGDP